jgi:Family of unknown function (DUF6461)
MAATADTYSWFSTLFPALARAYCITLVRGLSPEQVLGRLGGAEPAGEITGVDALVAAAAPGFMAAVRAGSAQASGVEAGSGQAGNWTLAVEPGGTLGTTQSVMLPLAASTRVVSHSRDASAAAQFCWLENGSARLCFDPLFPTRQSGSYAHEYDDLMRASGFNVAGENEYLESTHAAAAFALAEELTGVRITLGLLDETPYQCAVVRPPRGAMPQ